MRLDRFLSKTLGESRTNVKKLIRNRLIFVNDEVIISDGFHIDTAVDIVRYLDQVLHYEEFQYYLINKPAGYVCAIEDNINPTIVEYAPEFIKYKLHTVGRLDKDTTGALILTNDGRLTHRLISPKNAIEKVYIAEVDSDIDESLIPQFSGGFVINDEFKTLPATLEIINPQKARVTVIEGKYHQIKRMFAAFGLKVLSLHRERFANLLVDDLALGEYRPLTREELKSLIKD